MRATQMAQVVQMVVALPQRIKDNENHQQREEKRHDSLRAPALLRGGTLRFAVVEHIRTTRVADGTQRQKGRWTPRARGNEKGWLGSHPAANSLVAGACNTSNLLLTGFRLEIVRPAA